MIRTPLLAALTLLVAAPSLPQPAAHPAAVVSARSYRPIDDIRWTYDDANVRQGRPERQLRLQHDRSNSSIDSLTDSAVQAIVTAIAQSRPGQALSFILTREAGTIACTGTALDGGRASGTCRFDPDERFSASLAARGIVPHDSEEMLALAMVDAHLATADGLSRAGFRLDGAGDLIAVSALGITPAYAGDLRGAGLRIGKVGDLIAAKALKIDAHWLGDMAQAGYPALDVGRAIQMRALGVTPDYAARMARVLRQAGEIQ